MGCWNETCALSNLPVHAGAKVACLLAYPSRSGSEHSTFRYYTPAPIFMYGDYDDYGSVENGYTDQLSFLRILLDPYYKVDYVGDDDSQTIYNITRAACGGGVSLVNNKSFRNELRGDKNPHTPAYNIMILQSVLDKLLERYSYEVYVTPSKKGGKALDWDNAYYRTVNYHVLVGQIDEYIEILRAELDRDIHKISPSLSFMELPYKTDNEEKNDLAAFAHWHAQSRGEFFTRDFKEFIKTTMLEGREDELKAMLKEFAKFAIINYFLHDARKEFLVPSITSQEVETTAQILLAEITIETGKELDAYYEE